MTRMLLVVLLAVLIGGFATLNSAPPMVKSEQHDMLMETARRLQEQDKQLDALLILLRTDQTQRESEVTIPSRLAR